MTQASLLELPSAMESWGGGPRAISRGVTLDRHLVSAEGERIGHGELGRGPATESRGPELAQRPSSTGSWGGGPPQAHYIDIQNFIYQNWNVRSGNGL